MCRSFERGAQTVKYMFVQQCISLQSVPLKEKFTLICTSVNGIETAHMVLNTGESGVIHSCRVAHAQQTASLAHDFIMGSRIGGLRK